MKYHILRKEDLDKFIKKLSGKMKVYAPVKKGKNYAFEEVSGADEIELNYLPTILPPKKYLMPQREVIWEYDMGEGSPKDSPVLDYEESAVFGVHTCDLAGISCLDTVFSEDPRDVNYLKRKDRTFIIGLECLEYCDEKASCVLVNAHLPSGGGYDMFFTDIGDSYLVHVRTDKAEEIAAEMDFMPEASGADKSWLDKIREGKREKFKCELSGGGSKDVYAAFGKGEKAGIWKELGEKCVSCGNCTNVCPTCYCFDIKETVNLDLKSGFKVRTWDSCQFNTFAEVAGGENFREDRAERQRHRYYRKFKYPYDKYGKFFCTGCGRCTRACMAGISLKETLKSLLKETV